ncbi:MAG: ABC transporter substrate binding protein [Anaerolineales bacterium]
MSKQETSPTQKRKSSALTPGKIAGFVTILGIMLLVLAAAFPAQVAAQSVRKQVLFINSYHVGYKFSDDITQALRETFEEQGNIELRVEYLDTKRLDSPEYLEQIRVLYQAKYKETDLDLIISSDDAALNFLFRHADSLFPDVPVVFVGANFFDTTRLEGYERFTGISEEADIAGTLDIALQLQPSVTRVVVVNDTTVTGQIVRRTFDEVTPQYPQITFEFLEDVSMSEVQQRVSSLSSDSLVLLTIFSRDKDGVFYEYDQFTPLITQSSAVPVYGTWDFSLGYGIVGGKLTSGYTEGQRGANVAIRILNGEDPRNIPVEKQTQAQYMFDNNALERWNIPLSRLPEGSFVLDQPVSFYEQNPTLVWSVGIGFIVLLFVIAILVINNNQRRIAQRKLAVSNKELQDFRVALEQRVEERTKALATVSEISTAASTVLEINKLLQDVVNLSKERFGLYHAHIYLLDDAGEKLVLVSGAGEAGSQMVAEGRSIPLEQEKSLVARAARERRGVTVNDVTLEPDFLPNPLLPDTRAELAVPMMVGEKVIGVFDVQSESVGRFSDADISVQTTLAAQIASAVQNARSYTEISRSQELLADSLRVARLGNWEFDLAKDTFTFNDQFYSVFRTSAEDIGGYKLSSAEYASKFVHPDDAHLVGSEIQRALTTKERYFHASAEHRTIFPDGEIGYITVNITVERDENGEIIRWYGANQDITERRRLEELTRQRAERETTLNLITRKIQSTTSMQEALQITARELGHALGKKPTLVSLDAPTKMTKQDKSIS